MIKDEDSQPTMTKDNHKQLYARIEQHGRVSRTQIWELYKPPCVQRGTLDALNQNPIRQSIIAI